MTASPADRKSKQVSVPQVVSVNETYGFVITFGFAKLLQRHFLGLAWDPSTAGSGKETDAAPSVVVLKETKTNDK
jgi:hypothetical protein